MKTMLEFDHKKATQAINYFAAKGGGQIGKLKLIKLIYLADRYHLRTYGRPIMNDAYFAMPFGPVGSSVKDIAEFSDFLAEEELSYAGKYILRIDHKTIASRTDVDKDVFSQSEMEALDFVWNEFGGDSASRLVDLTHIYPEWARFKNALESKETTREPMSYADFFKNPNNPKDKFLTDSEKLEASKQLFDDNFLISEYWR